MQQNTNPLPETTSQSLPPLPEATAQGLPPLPTTPVTSPASVVQATPGNSVVLPVDNTISNISPLATPPANITNTTVAPKKSGNTGKVFLIIIIFLLIVVIAGLGIAGYYSYNLMRKQYVPALSPMFEDLVNKPSEQLAQKVDIYADLVLASIQAAAPSSLGGNVDQSSINGILQKYKSMSFTFLIDAKLQNLSSSPVLGLQSAPGSVDMDTFQKMMSAKDMEYQVNTKFSYNNLDTKTPDVSADTTLDIAAAGSQIGTHIKTISVKDANSTNQLMYVLLDYFPVNPYIDTTTIEKKWIKIPIPSTDSLATTGSSAAGLSKSESSVLTDPAKTQKAIEEFKQVLRTPTMQKNITQLPEETIKGMDSKCYSLHLAGADWKQLAKEVYEIYKDEINDPNYLTNLDKDTTTGTADMTLNMCFDNASLLLDKVSTDIKTTSNIQNADINATLTIESVNQPQNILAPTDNLMNAADIDMTKLMKPALTDMLSSTMQNFSEVRNTQRSSDVIQILNAVSQYTSEPGHQLSDFGNIPLCTAMPAHIGNGVDNIDLGKKLVDAYMVGIPSDPNAVPDGSDTGYTICTTSTGRVQIAAPFAESGKVILVVR